MTVSAITTTASPAVDDVAPAGDVALPSTSTTPTGDTARPHRHHHSTAKISEMGQMLSKLQSLATSKPDEFTSLASSIADKLTAAAQQASGDDATRLTELADRFRTAAQDGTTEALQPHAPAATVAGRSQAYSDAATRPDASRNRQTFDDIFGLVENA